MLSFIANHRYITMPQSFSNSLIHIIYSTKNREEFIDEEIESKLYGYLGEVCNNQKCQTIIINGYRNHVHILCSLHRTISQSKLLELLKSSSSKWIKTQGAKYNNFFWQDGYAVYSVSQSNTVAVIDYIKNQKEHHQNKSFKDEYREFLRVNKVEFNEQYMWD